MMQNIYIGVKSLFLHKMRSLLTMLGIVFGVASVIAMLAVGEGARQKSMDQIRQLGSKNIIIASAKPNEDVGSPSIHKRMSMYGLLYEDQKRIADAFNAVRVVVPAKILHKEGRMQSRSMPLRVVGTTSDWFNLVRRPILIGRSLNDADSFNVSNVVVLTESGARKLLATKHAIGESVRIGGDYFHVVGVLRNEGMVDNSHLVDSEIDAYMPLATAREYYSDLNITRTTGSYIRERVELSMLIVEVREEDQVELVSNGISRLLETFHEKEDYSIHVPKLLINQIEKQANIWKWTLFSIASISLLIGGIGIMNIMLASVTERTREIGIRRAIGAKKRQIVGQFLIETTVLSSAGGLLGVLLGPVIAILITFRSDMAAIVTIESIVLAAGISMVIGIVFGLYPAIRAADLDPIVALRHE